MVGLVTVMCLQQKAQANGQTVAEPQQEIKVTEEKKKPASALAPTPAPAQPPADAKVGFTQYSFWFRRGSVCLYVCSKNNCSIKVIAFHSSQQQNSLEIFFANNIEHNYAMTYLLRTFMQHFEIKLNTLFPICHVTIN